MRERSSARAARRGHWRGQSLTSAWSKERASVNAASLIHTASVGHDARPRLYHQTTPAAAISTLGVAWPAVRAESDQLRAVRCRRCFTFRIPVLHMFSGAHEYISIRELFHGQRYHTSAQMPKWTRPLYFLYSSM